MTTEESDPAIATAVRAWRAAVLLYLGDPTGWEVAAHVPAWTGSHEQGLELLRGSQHLAAATLLLGRFDRAAAYLREAEQIRSALGLARWVPWLATIRVALRWRRGEWQDLEAEARRLLETTRETPLRALTNYVVLGSLALSTGKIVEAERLLHEAAELSETTGSLVGLTGALTPLSRLSFTRGDLVGAVNFATRGLVAIRSKGAWVRADGVAPWAVRAMLASGRVADAERVTSELAEGLRNRDAPAAKPRYSSARGFLPKQPETVRQHRTPSNRPSRAGHCFPNLTKRPKRKSSGQPACSASAGRKVPPSCINACRPSETSAPPGTWPG